MTLIAVTKFVEPDRILEAIDSGISDVGENRVQEFLEKELFFRNNKIHSHLIGQLQTNKVKYIMSKVKLIQSVDRLRLAQELNRVAEAKNAVQDVLIEINIGGEEQKGGVHAYELYDLLYMISAMSRIRVKGLMCIPPAVSEREARSYFASMRKLFDETAAKRIPNVAMEILSMGMSGDYMAAIAEGSTMVRIGSAIFGERV